jgi:hypothetical protein
MSVSGLLSQVVTVRLSASAGIWHHVFDSSNKIKEIWFLRQLSHDELESKVSKQAAWSSVDWSPRMMTHSILQAESGVCCAADEGEAVPDELRLVQVQGLQRRAI